MHYYQFHIGDYRAGTAHLSDMEDLTYRRLLDMYYDTEQPIPLDLQWVARRTRTPAEVIPVVLRDFFRETPDGWVNDRADAEIAAYREKHEQAARAGRASAERRKQARSTDVATTVQPTNNQEPETNNQLFPPSEGVDAGAVNAPRRPACPAEKLVDAYHELCPSLQRVMMLNDTRKRHLVSRWREVVATDNITDAREGVEIFRQFFQRVSQSDFLCGRTQSRGGRAWKATFDWLVLPTNFLKVCEGHYDNGRA